MIGILPKSLEVCGKSYAINSDFRVVLKIFAAFNDNELTDLEKAYVCVKCLFADNIPDKLFNEAAEKAFWFCDGGNMPKSEPGKVKILDWEQDEGIIFPAINKVAGTEIRELDFMHWWTFLGCFGEIDEGLFSTVMHIRQKKARGKKLEKWEQEFYNKNKSLISIVNKEDREAVRETEEFLKTLI